MYRKASTPYFEELGERISRHGGLFNAHLHLDRAGTYHATVDILAGRGEKHGATLPLSGKHALIPLIHASRLYDPDVLEERTASFLDQMVALGTSRADSVVDCTTDRVGLSSLESFLRLKERYAARIDFRSGAYSPHGFRDDEPGRWDLVRRAAGMADFIGLLPERDDHALYPAHIGFRESARRGLILAAELGKGVHIHVDQANHAYEDGSETVVSIVRELGLSAVGRGEPMVWLIHAISPSRYEDARFERLVADMAELNIGVIVCPSAAISMRQYRVFATPTSNSIARVLELLAAGIHVRIGSDNICDITSPMGTPDLMDELFVLANAVRFYDIEVFAKLGAGVALDDADRARIRDHLAVNAHFVEETARRYIGK